MLKNIFNGISADTEQSSVVIKPSIFADKNNKNKKNQKSEVEAWHEPVDGKELFKGLVKVFGKYLILQDHQAETLALWSIFSHCFEANNIAPKLLIHSPEKRCGKTTLLDVLTGLVWKPLPASNITPAAMFRVIDSMGGTIIIDEADTFLNNNSEFNGIINSGHRKTQAFVLRCVGDNHEPKKFSTWTPNIIAMIGKPKDTIIDRSIIISMRRKKTDEKIERFIPHKVEKELNILMQQIIRWCQDNFDILKEADPEVPNTLNDRASDNWRPLFAIADLIGKECSSVARKAAITLSETSDDEDNASPALLLLSDISDIFTSTDDRRISTEALLVNLYEREDSPWAEWNRGKPISARQVAKYLKPFGIKPKKYRVGSYTHRGYEVDQFKDTFCRYLSGTKEQTNKNNDLDDNSHGTSNQSVPDTSNYNPLIYNDSSTVPDNYRVEVPDKYKIQIPDEHEYLSKKDSSTLFDD